MVGYIYEDVLFSADLWTKGATCRMLKNEGYLYTLNPCGTTASRHPEAERNVLEALRNKARKADRKGKMIIYYTMIRLRLHFLFR